MLILARGAYVSDGFRSTWRPRGAWDDVIVERSFGAQVSMPGVIVQPLLPAEMVTLMIDHSSLNSLSKVRGKLSVDLPATGTAIKGPNFDLVWIAPGQCLAISKEHGLAQRLQNLVGDDVAVVDQTGARATVRLSGV